MDSSRLYGLPVISTAQATPSSQAPANALSFAGIRAPLTIDDFDDLEHSSSPSNGSASEVFISGEDVFDTDSERPFVDDLYPDPDSNEQTIEGTLFVNEFDYRPSVEYSYGESVEDKNNLDEFDNSISSLTGPDVENVEYSDFRQGIPIALLSVDDDDDSEGSVVMEDDGFSGAVRIPSSRVLESIGSAPKVRVLAVEGEEDNELEYENTIEADIVVAEGGEDDELEYENAQEKQVVVDSVLHWNAKSLGSDYDKQHIEECTVSDLVPVEIVEYKNCDVEEIKVECKVASKEPLQLRELKYSGMQLEEGITVSDLVPAEIVEYKDCDVEEIKVECKVASKEPLPLRELESSGRQLEEDIQLLYMDAENIKIVNLDIDPKPSVVFKWVMEEPKELKFIGTDDMATENSNLQVGETAGLSQIGNNEIQYSKVKQEIHRYVESQSCDFKSNVVQSSDGAENMQILAAQDQLFPLSCSEVDTTQGLAEGNELSRDSNISQSMAINSLSELRMNNEDDNFAFKSVEDEDNSFLFNNDEGLTFKDSDGVKEIIDQSDYKFSRSLPDGESSLDHLQNIDGEIVTDSDVEVDTIEENKEKEVFDTAALTALLKAAGFGSTFQLSEPVSQLSNSNIFAPADHTVEHKAEGILSEDERSKLEKIQQLRLKFLCLIHSLNQPPEDSIAAEVFYWLALATGKPLAQAFNLDSAQTEALQFEAEGRNDLNLSLNVLVIGKTGVGKSATINSIFREDKAVTDAFKPATTTVKEMVGMLEGVIVRVLDTPGLRSSIPEQIYNRKVLLSIKKAMTRCPPDVVLYVDRLDIQTRDLCDLPLLKSITKYLGPSIWDKTIVTLTHAASSPPDGPTGKPLSYEMFVAQRLRAIQQLINHSVGDLHIMCAGLMSRISLVENHSLCRRNENGEMLLPNGKSWRSQLLLLCYSMKILSELRSVIKTRDPLDPGKHSGFQMRLPPLTYFLSSLLQSNVHPKCQGEDVDSDMELAYLSNSDEGDKDDYDNLPPCKPLRKSQTANLSKEQKKAYFEECDYRVKLLKEKQWREEVKRFRGMKKKEKNNVSDYMADDEDKGRGSLEDEVVSLPDRELPPSFDGDDASYRYRRLEPSTRVLTGPILKSYGWDHDYGYDGVTVEDQSTLVKKVACILKGETKIKNLKMNITAAGVSITFLGKNVISGLKLEDQLALGKRLILVGSTGAIISQGDAAYGVNLEIRLKEKDYPVGQNRNALGLSLMKWKGDLIWGCNLQSHLCVGRSCKVAVRAELNKKLGGHISIRTSSSDYTQIAMLGVITLAKDIMRRIYPRDL